MSIPYAGIETLGAFTPDSLIAGTFPIQTATVTIAAGQTLKRGALLSKGEDDACSLLAGDGTIYAVLADDITTGEETGSAEVYLSGVFNVNAMTAGEGVDIMSLADEARKLCLYFVRNK